MLWLILLIKSIVSSIVLLGCLLRYLFISLSERNAKMPCWSWIDNCLRVSLAVVKIGKGVKYLSVINHLFFVNVGPCQSLALAIIFTPIYCALHKNVRLWHALVDDVDSGWKGFGCQMEVQFQLPGSSVHRTGRRTSSGIQLIAGIFARIKYPMHYKMQRR